MAIDDLLDEHEQSERVRTWLRNNGAGLIGGVVLGLAVIVGWQWWQRQQAQQAEAGRRLPGCAEQPGSTSDLKKAQAEVAELRDGTPMPTWPRCDLAKAQVEAGAARRRHRHACARSSRDPGLTADGRTSAWRAC